MMLNLFLNLLFQYQADPIRASELAEKALRSEGKAHEESAAKRVLADRIRFQERYEALGRAMDKFTLAYNAGRGNVWPKREAEALAKAIRALESTVAWRQPSRSASDHRPAKLVEATEITAPE